MWLGTVLVLEHGHSLGFDDLGNRIVRIPEIRQPARAKGTALDAGRHHALGNSVVTEVAFVGDLVIRVKEADAIRAGHDAVAATDTPFPVDQHDTVVGLLRRADRTYLDTVRVLTLVAKLRHKEGLVNRVRIDLLVTDFIAGEAIAAAVR